MRLPWGGEENSGQTKIFANGAEFLFILFLMVRILLYFITSLFLIRNSTMSGSNLDFLYSFDRFTLVVPKEFYIFELENQLIIMFVFGTIKALFRPCLGLV